MLGGELGPSRFVPPNLPFGRFVLRPLRPEDAQAWYSYLSDQRVTEHTSWPPITREFISALVERLIEDYDEPRSLRWALVTQADDVLVGSCGFTSWHIEDRTAELAYDLAPALWRQGLMSAAVTQAVGWALRFGALRRIEAFVMTTNEPSIRLLDRAGFVRERLLAGHRVARGVPRDFFQYAMAAIPSGKQ
jgi:RimJ/RimL family protein N-acetyltransferase